ncbi:MAG: M23 family metallopeptidase [bacterium]
MKHHLVLAVFVATVLFAPYQVSAQYYSDYSHDHTPTITPSGPPSIIFPMQGGASFTDDFGDARSGGRVHEGNDLMAQKMTPILAARGGRVVYAPTTEPSYGFMLTISGEDGYEYGYLHINNDTPGTDDGLGGLQNAYAPGISEGVHVTQGQHIAWVGDSGNAEAVGPHLHFEIRLPDGTAINPYPYLTVALKLDSYDIAAAKAASPDINTDKNLVGASDTVYHCTPGSLIRTTLSSSVYYCGADGRRYVFPNQHTYATWYPDFSTVLTITPENLAAMLLGGNVTYRPGVKLVKITTDPKVYAVDQNGLLRWVETPGIAVKYYGAAWMKNVEDIPDVFFVNYKIGNPISE